MNRPRLTASALAAASLSSITLGGLGATAAHAAPVTVAPGTGYSGMGFDTCTAPSDAQMDDWYAHSPYHAVGVYLGGSAYTGVPGAPKAAINCANWTDPNDPTSIWNNHGGYTPAWVQHQAAAGWAMWALYSGAQAKDLAVAGADPTALGASDAQDAAVQAQKLGFANGSIIFADMETYTQPTTSPLVVAYLKSFAATLATQPGNYRAGLYGNSAAAGSPSAISDAAADPTLRSTLAAVDIANWAAPQANFRASVNDRNLDPTAWAQHQRIHQYFGGHNETYGTTTLNIDTNQLDLAPTPTGPRGTVDRWAGGDRYATAVNASQHLWPNAVDAASQWQGRPAAAAAVLTRGDQFADALGGSALAAHVGGPLLLTATNALTPSTADELTRTLQPGATVYVLGGEKAVSPAVFNAVAARGFIPVRVAGPDRFATAVSIAQTMAADMKDGSGAPAVQRVMVATGVNYADALSAGTAAGATPDTVLLLTNDKVMPPATAAYLAQISGAASGPNSATVYPVGGQANAAVQTLTSVPAANMRLGTLVGIDRYNTSQLVAQQFFASTGLPHTVGIATGTDFPDALSGGAAMATLGGPLLLTPSTSVSGATQAYLNGVLPSRAVDAVHVFGGTKAVGDVVLGTLQGQIQP